MSTDEFQALVWRFYNTNKRSMPWRMAEADGSYDPYKILVSEVMLQQTQVERVIPKYEAFIQKFPQMEDLALANVADVLKQWSGLGYNRRALYVHEAARQLAGHPFPQSIDRLIELRGIGANTASAVLVYSYNKPLTFIETNIRTVYLHHFFPQDDSVSDKEILEKVSKTIDVDNPREFYWALMDYGSILKKQGTNHLARSKSYARQSSFTGSNRQIRGQILKLLARNSQVTLNDLKNEISDKRFNDVLQQLEHEGFLSVKNNLVSLAE